MQNQANAFYNCMSGQAPSISNVPGLPDRSACPPQPEMREPPVRFNIRLVQSPPARAREPVVGLHRCYNAELSGASQTDCAAIRRHALEQCADNIRLWQRQGRVGGSARFAPEMREFLDNITIAPRPASPTDAPARASAAPDFLRMSPAQMTTYCESENPEASDGRYDREDSGNYTLNTEAGTVLHEVGHALGLQDEYQDPAYPFLPQGEHDSLMNNSGAPSAGLRERHLSRILEPLACPRRGRRGR